MKLNQKRYIPLFLIVSLCLMGFDFDLNQWLKPKQESKQTKSTQRKTSPPSQADSKSQPPGEEKEPPSQKALPAVDSGGTGGTNERTPVIPPPVAAPVPVTMTPQIVNRDIARLQGDLEAITKQTKVIQSQSAADRLRLQKVLEQTKMQQRLVDSLKTPPKPVTTKQAVNTDEVVRQTKIRLIAEDVRKTQELLRTSNTANQLHTVSRPPVRVQKN